MIDRSNGVCLSISECFDVAFADAPIGVALLTEDGRFERGNPRLMHMLRLNNDELCGRSPAELAATASAFSRESDEPPAGTEQPWRRSDGSLLHVRLTHSVTQTAVGRGKSLLYVEDLTGEKTSEQSRRRLADIIEATPDFVSTATPDQCIQYLNRSARELLGLENAPSRHPTRIEQVHPRWAYEKIRDEAIPAAHRCGWWSGETAVLDHFGREIPISQVILSHANPDGSVQYLSTIGRDLRQRKRTEAMLLEIAHAVSTSMADALFNELVQHLAHIMHADVAFVAELIEPDRVRTVAAWRDEQFVENFDYVLKDAPCEHVIGQQLRFYPQRVQEIFPKDNLLKDLGAEAYLGMPLFDSSGQPMGLIAVTSRRPMTGEITPRSALQIFAARAGAELERIRNERALQQSEALYRAFFDAAAAGIVQLDFPAGRFMRVNDAFCRLVGYSREELLERTFYDITHADDFDRDLKGIEKMRRGEVDHCETEKRFVRKDGAVVWVKSNSILAQTGADRLYCVAIVQDITERKQFETELERARDGAERANRTKDHFLAVLSHELRTPLTPVLGLVSMMERDANLPADVREDATIIRRNIEAEARLIDDLLDLTRIARGKIKLKCEAVRLASVLQNAIDICRAEIDDKHIELSTGIQAADRDIWADPGRIQQVFVNLLQNAAKFTPERGHIWISAEAAGPIVRTSIRDDGIGIAPEQLDRIFEAFEQAAQASGHRPGGLGLGLSIARSLVQMHGGEIRAESRGQGLGATFTVELPTDAQPRSSEIDPPAGSVSP